MTTFETIVGVFIITNTVAQLYDIVWCRWHHCGKSSKNSTEPKDIREQEDVEDTTQSVGSLPEDWFTNTRKGNK